MKSLLFRVASLLTLAGHILAGEPAKPTPTAPGRPVRVTAFSFRPGPTLDQVVRHLDEEGARGVDLMVLPETWRGQSNRTLETADGPTIRALATDRKSVV